MEQKDLKEKKEDILKELFLDESSMLIELNVLVKMSKQFFMIERATGRIILNQEENVGNKEKICLLLIGKYFAKEMGVINSAAMKRNDISAELKIVRTTLTRPIKELVDEGILQKTGDKEYHISYYKIKSVLERLGGKNGRN